MFYPGRAGTERHPALRRRAVGVRDSRDLRRGDTRITAAARRQAGDGRSGPVPATADGRPRPRRRPRPIRERWWSLVVIGLAQLMIVLDVTVVTIALPSAQTELHIASADKQWVLTAYTLAFGGLLLIGGKIVDFVGRKNTLIIGLIGFAAAPRRSAARPSAAGCSSAPVPCRAPSAPSSPPPRSPC